MKPHVLTCSFLLLSEAIALAPTAPQSPGAARIEAASRPAAVAPVRDQGRDADGHALGSWAVGDQFKCGFVDGAFTLVPYLGRSAPANAPWSWRTAAATLGGADLLGHGPAHEDHGALQLRARRGLVTERWDVHGDAVDQSFVIAEAPVRGNLVLRGVVDSTLHCAPREPAVAPLVFRDAGGRVELRYGTAMAIDSNGDSWPMPVGCSGGEVELHLDAAAVAAARFPLLVDPRITVYVLDSGVTAGSGVVDTAVEAVDASDRMTLVRAEVRWASSLDGDLLVWKCRDDFGASVLLYSDVAPQVAAYDVAVAAADTNSSYVVAWSRGPLGGQTTISWFAQHADSQALPVVRTASHPSSVGERAPRLGGRKGVLDPASRMLLVRLRDPIDTDTTQVWGSVIDCATGTEGTPFLVSGGDAVSLACDHDEPWVARDLVGTWGHWLVAYQIWRPADNRWNVHVRRVSYDGVVANGVFVPDQPANSHAMQPRVEGSHNRFLVAFATVATAYAPGKTTNYGGMNVYVQRFSWSGFAPQADHPERNVAASFSRDLVLGGLAHDHHTQSHWVLVQGFLQGGHTAMRIGYRGRVLESEALPGPTAGQTIFRPAAVAYDGQLQRFPLHYGVRNVQNGVATFRSYAGRYDHPPLAAPSIYGQACGGAGSIGWISRFLVGAEFAGIGYIGSTPNRLVACAVSLGQANTPLAAFGVGGGCNLLVDVSAANFLGAVFLVTDSSGDARLPMPLPEGLGPLDLDAQWLVLQPDGTVRSTYGEHIEIR